MAGYAEGKERAGSNRFVFLQAGGYMKTITRAKCLDRIIERNGTPDIRIITGIRRSGKSKRMQTYTCSGRREESGVLRLL